MNGNLVNSEASDSKASCVKLCQNDFLQIFRTIDRFPVHEPMDISLTNNFASAVHPFPRHTRHPCTSKYPQLVLFPKSFRPKPRTAVSLIITGFDDCAYLQVLSDSLIPSVLSSSNSCQFPGTLEPVKMGRYSIGPSVQESSPLAVLSLSSIDVVSKADW